MIYLLSLIALSLAVGLPLLINRLTNISRDISAIREHTHSTHMRAVQISQLAEKASYKYHYKY